MIQKLKRKEIATILNVKIEGLKTIEKRKQLKNRLYEKGYLLISKTKVGRSYVYKVEQICKSKELLNNISCIMFDTRDDETLSDYILYRLYNITKPITKNMIADYCEVNRKTITKWDEKMIENGFLTRDGYFYMLIIYDNNGNKTYSLTDKYEYASYIKNSKYANKTRNIAEKYKKDIISYDEMMVALEGIKSYAKAVDKKFVYKINKFNIVKNNELFKEFIKLIIDVKGKELAKSECYNINWLPEPKDN